MFKLFKKYKENHGFLEKGLEIFSHELEKMDFEGLKRLVEGECLIKRRVNGRQFEFLLEPSFEGNGDFFYLSRFQKNVVLHFFMDTRHILLLNEKTGRSIIRSRSLGKNA